MRGEPARLAMAYSRPARAVRAAAARSTAACGVGRPRKKRKACAFQPQVLKCSSACGIVSLSRLSMCTSLVACVYPNACEGIEVPPTCTASAAAGRNSMRHMPPAQPGSDGTLPAQLWHHYAAAST